MDTKIFITKADLLKEVKERGMKNMATMKKSEIAEKLGVTLTPRPGLSIDEKRNKMKAYQRRHYQKKKKKTAERKPHPSTTSMYMYNILVYMIILFLFIMNKALLSF